MNEHVYNYAGLMADLALHLEQEVLTKANERIAFGCKSIETTSDDQYVSYRYKDIAMPDAIKNDKSYSISHTVTFAKHLPKDGEDEGDYIDCPYQLLCKGAAGVSEGKVVMYELYDGDYISRASWPVVFSSAG